MSLMFLEALLPDGDGKIIHIDIVSNSTKNRFKLQDGWVDG